MGFVADLVINDLEVQVPFPWDISIVSNMAYPEMAQNDEGFLNGVRTVVEDQFFDAIEIPRPPEHLWNKLDKILEETPTIIVGQLEVIQRGFNPSAIDDPKRKEALENLGKAIEEAGNHDAFLFALCSGPDPGSNKRGEATIKLVESLKELCAKADEYDIELLLETFDRNQDRKQLIGPMDEAVKVVEEVRKNYDNIGVMWDLSHGPLIGEKPNVLRKAGDVLEHIHMGCAKKTDAGGLLDQHPGFYTRNSVNTSDDLADLLEVLMEIEYFGLVGFEVKPQEYQTSKEVVHAAKSTLIEAFHKVIPRILRK